MCVYIGLNCIHREKNHNLNVVRIVDQTYCCSLRRTIIFWLTAAQRNHRFRFIESVDFKFFSNPFLAYFATKNVFSKNKFEIAKQ